jgi:hypothetical protein
MEQENQGPSAIPVTMVNEEALAAAADARRARRGLTLWLGLLLGGALAGLALDQPEAAALVGLATLFAAAQAADLDPLWQRAWQILAFVPPLGGVLFFGYLATVVLPSDLPLAQRLAGIGFATAGIVVMGLSAVPAFASGLARRLFGAAPSYALRLGAQLTAAGLLLAVPAWFAFDALKETLLQDPASLLAKAKLSGALVGYVLLALGGVGCGVRRDLRQTLARLGLTPLTLRHAGIVFAGALGLFVLNAGAEAFQHRFFPGLWKVDHEMTRLIASAMTPGRMVLLALSAGVGEEVTLRGGLQPRLGIGLTALLFAALHVQYSWFGMVLVFTLGVVLGLVRKHGSTTAAIIVHGLYDTLAVFSS